MARRVAPPVSRPTIQESAPAGVVLRKLVQKLGMHPDDPDAVDFDLAGKRALVVGTNTGVMDIGKPTGVFSSELTVPYYAFLDAGMVVDVASPLGGVIPVDPLSLKPVLRCAQDDRFLADDDLRDRVTKLSRHRGPRHGRLRHPVPRGGLGRGVRFRILRRGLGSKVTEANAHGKIIGGVCHGPLGLIRAKGLDGEPLVKGRKISAVTDKQVKELGIESTPHHPERELRKVGAEFESATRFRVHSLITGSSTATSSRARTRTPGRWSPGR